MPLRLNVGLSKKIGQPDYGSLGASCNVELELESTLIQSDPDAFQRHIRNAFLACRQAVQEELSREQQGSCSGSSVNGNGHPNGQKNGHSRSHGRKATASQARAIYAIADRQGIELSGLLHSRGGVDVVEELTITEASQLIDELKGATNGTGGTR